jgi:hypothetical protein
MKKPQKQLTIQFSEDIERAIRAFAAANGDISVTSAIRILVASGLAHSKK